MNKGWLIRNGPRIVIHVISWALFFSFPYLVQPRLAQPALAILTQERQLYYFLLLKSTLLVPLFYANAYWLIPRLLYGKKPLYFLLVTAAVFLVLVGWDVVLLKSFDSTAVFDAGYQIPFNLPIFVFIIIASITFHVTRERMLVKERFKEHQTIHLQTELSFLRSQISPHFMFNVLNNMVALARKKSDLLEPSLIKLSRLLRYMLYETNESSVPLEREVEYLQSYIDLQKQRFGKSLTIKTYFDLKDINYRIEPMLLIPFVENAFKHGTVIIDSFISISLTQQGSALTFNVQNHFEDNLSVHKDKTSGIGLSNVKRRLNLLYQDRHTLELNKENGLFTAYLTINLH